MATAAKAAHCFLVVVVLSQSPAVAPAAAVTLWPVGAVLSLLRPAASVRLLLRERNQDNGGTQLQQDGLPFGHGHQGCRNLIERCGGNGAHGSLQAWYTANWEAWQIGFTECCDLAGYDDGLCTSLNATLFDFSKVSAAKKRGFHKSDLVYKAPEPYLTDFCQEAGSILQLHFSHTPFLDGETAAMPRSKTTSRPPTPAALVQVGAQVHNGVVYFLKCGAPTANVTCEWRMKGTPDWSPFSSPATWTQGFWVCHWNRGNFNFHIRMGGDITDEETAVAAGPPSCQSDAALAGAREPAALFTQDLARAGHLREDRASGLTNTSVVRDRAVSAKLQMGSSGGAAAIAGELFRLSAQGGLRAARHRLDRCEADAACEESIRTVQRYLRTVVGEEWAFMKYAAAQDCMNRAFPMNCPRDQQSLWGHETKGPAYTDELTCKQRYKNVGSVFFCARWNYTCQWDPSDNKCVVSTFDCFPSSAQVSLARGGEVSVSRLERGDRLLSPDVDAKGLLHADFMADAHMRDPGHEDAELEFVELTHELMKPARPLLITPRHFLFAAGTDGDWAFVPAARLREGDRLLAMAANTTELAPSRVTAVRRVRARGAWSPLTTSGRLLVEGVAVSSYALRAGSQEALWESSPASRARSEALWHLGLLPTRILYWVGLDFGLLHNPRVSRFFMDVVDWLVASVSRLTAHLG